MNIETRRIVAGIRQKAAAAPARAAAALILSLVAGSGHTAHPPPVAHHSDFAVTARYVFAQDHPIERTDHHG